ncbi:MAG: membrane protein insertase YidC [Kiritimatiellae bacterium]|nr:membrane protein insertase YidC [Kiritimatiellia bacterium]
MNKQEKFISLLFGLAIIGYFFFNANSKKADVLEDVPVAQTQTAVEQAPVQAAQVQVAPSSTVVEKKVSHVKPEKIVVLKNNLVEVEFSSWGAVAKKATLLKYATSPGKISESNPPVCLDFKDAPAFALDGIDNLASDADYDVVNQTSNSVTFANAFISRTFTLKDNYGIALEEKLAGEGVNRANTISIGSLSMGTSKNDILSVDSWVNKIGADGDTVEHHSETEPLKGLLVSGAGGCGGSPSGENKDRIERTILGSRKWVALKSRFFVTALAKSSDVNNGFSVVINNDTTKQTYSPKSISAAISFDKLEKSRSMEFFVGPKKQSLLWDLGMKDVMEFGMWRWVCYPIVWFLNACNDFIISGFGIAILILTLILRVIFWPLTHKSTVGMRKMQEIQPKIKEVREKFKDNPQRMNMEMMALYREHKVNPMSSCLPMLVQIPIFIALFTVLRSAVELRYAPFLWIADLSEPECLFPELFSAIGGLNILPILMALTMGVQSALTPSTGDKNQQRMMMVIMPIMMLVMFYSFPSALSLYWTVSQVLSIAQMWWIRKNYNPENAQA